MPARESGPSVNICKTAKEHSARGSLVRQVQVEGFTRSLILTGKAVKEVFHLPRCDTSSKQHAPRKKERKQTDRRAVKFFFCAFAGGVGPPPNQPTKARPMIVATLVQASAQPPRGSTTKRGQSVVSAVVVEAVVPPSCGCSGGTTVSACARNGCRSGFQARACNSCRSGCQPSRLRGCGAQLRVHERRHRDAGGASRAPPGPHIAP